MNIVEAELSAVLMTPDTLHVLMHYGFHMCFFLLYILLFNLYEDTYLGFAHR